MNSILPSFVWKVLGIGDVELRINISRGKYLTNDKW